MTELLSSYGQPAADGRQMDKLARGSKVSCRATYKTQDENITFIFPGILRERNKDGEMWVTSALTKMRYDISVHITNISKVADFKASFIEHMTKSNLNAIAYFVGCAVDDDLVTKKMVEDMTRFFKSGPEDPHFFDKEANQFMQNQNLVSRTRGKRVLYQTEDYYAEILSSKVLSDELDFILSDDLAHEKKKKTKHKMAKPTPAADKAVDTVAGAKRADATDAAAKAAEEAATAKAAEEAAAKAAEEAATAKAAQEAAAVAKAVAEEAAAAKAAKEAAAVKAAEDAAKAATFYWPTNKEAVAYVKAHWAVFK